MNIDKKQQNNYDGPIDELSKQFDTSKENCDIEGDVKGIGPDLQAKVENCSLTQPIYNSSLSAPIFRNSFILGCQRQDSQGGANELKSHETYGEQIPVAAFLVKDCFDDDVDICSSNGTKAISFKEK